MRRMVEIFDLDGKRLFSRLLDTGNEVMDFDSGFGFITKDQCRLYKWEIRETIKCKTCGFYPKTGPVYCSKCYEESANE